MVTIKIQREIIETKTVVVFPGDDIPNLDGTDSGRINESQTNIQLEIMRSPAEILFEEQSKIQAKRDEIQAEITAYKDAIQYQLDNGGPGPVARFEIMQIVNDHNDEFEVVFDEV